MCVRVLEIMEAANRNHEVAEKFFVHFAEWWREQFQSYRHLIPATHNVKSFNRRNQNCPKECEKRCIWMNLWMWQLKCTPWCPSNRGQTKSAQDVF